MLTSLVGLISYPGDIAMTFGVLAALTFAIATLPLRTGTGQHADAGPGAVDVWQLRETIRNAPRSYQPQSYEPHRHDPHRYEPRLYAPPEPDDDIVWPEEDWPDSPEAAHQAGPPGGASTPDQRRPPRRHEQAGPHEQSGARRRAEPPGTPELRGQPRPPELEPHHQPTESGWPNRPGWPSETPEPSARRPALPTPRPLRPAPAREENDYIGRHRLIEADLYGLPPGIELRLTRVRCAFT